jgi:hypothetical protein
MPLDLASKGLERPNVGWDSVVRKIAAHHVPQPFPLFVHGRVTRAWTSSRRSRSRLSIPVRDVCLASRKPPPSLSAQMCVPRKSKVSGLPRPGSARLWAANRPNSMSRALSGCSSSLNFSSLSA